MNAKNFKKLNSKSDSKNSKKNEERSKVLSYALSFFNKRQKLDRLSKSSKEETSNSVIKSVSKSRTITQKKELDQEEASFVLLTCFDSLPFLSYSKNLKKEMRKKINFSKKNKNKDEISEVLQLQNKKNIKKNLFIKKCECVCENIKKKTNETTENQNNSSYCCLSNSQQQNLSLQQNPSNPQQQQQIFFLNESRSQQSQSLSEQGRQIGDQGSDCIDLSQIIKKESYFGQFGGFSEFINYYEEKEKNKNSQNKENVPLIPTDSCIPISLSSSSLIPPLVPPLYQDNFNLDFNNNHFSNQTYFPNNDLLPSTNYLEDNSNFGFHNNPISSISFIGKQLLKEKPLNIKHYSTLDNPHIISSSSFKNLDKYNNLEKKCDAILEFLSHFDNKPYDQKPFPNPSNAPHDNHLFDNICPQKSKNKTNYFF